MKKNIFYLKIMSFTVFLLKFCCCMISTAVHFDGFLPSRCQVIFFHVYTNLKFQLVNKLPELNNLVCLKRWHCNYVMQKPHE